MTEWKASRLHAGDDHEGGAFRSHKPVAQFVPFLPAHSLVPGPQTFEEDRFLGMEAAFVQHRFCGAPTVSANDGWWEIASHRLTSSSAKYRKRVMQGSGVRQSYPRASLTNSLFTWLSGCGSKPMVPFWGRCSTHFSLFWWGLGCSLGYGILTRGQVTQTKHQGNFGICRHRGDATRRDTDRSSDPPGFGSMNAERDTVKPGV